MAEDGRHVATKNFPGALLRASACQATAAPGWVANRIAKGETVVVRPLPNSLATLRVRRWQSLTRRPESPAAETHLC